MGLAGVWKASRARSTASLTVTPFARLPQRAKEELAEEGEALLRFIEPDADRFALGFESG